MIRLGFALLALALFMGNYEICNLVYPDDINAWWGLKQNIYNLIIAISFYLASLDKKGWLNFLLNVGVGFCISNCIDRIFFDINSVTHADVLMIIITLATSYYNCIYKPVLCPQKR